MDTIKLQTNKSANQTDGIALGSFETELGALDASEVIETVMIDNDLPGIGGIESGLFQGHTQLTGRPAFQVAVCADCLEDLTPAIPLR